MPTFVDPLCWCSWVSEAFFACTYRIAFSLLAAVFRVHHHSTTGRFTKRALLAAGVIVFMRLALQLMRSGSGFITRSPSLAVSLLDEDPLLYRWLTQNRWPIVK